MLTAGDVLAKTLAKSQKNNFLEPKKWLWMFFFGSLLWMLLYRRHLQDFDPHKYYL